MTTLVLEVVASEASERQAASLIGRGRVKDPASWEAPSADRENEIIESKGWETYGRWFLGRDDNADPETKGAYKYPYTSDFANVDRRGLTAIRQRAGQTKEKTIFEAAGRLLEMIPESASSTRKNTAFHVAMRRRSIYEVDSDTGLIFDVSLIQEGEAKGHAMFIDEKSLDSALVSLGDSNLPAYVTHEGAVESDRLLNEIGVFSEFHVEGGKLKARQFKALTSFMADDPARFRRLFDLASEAPDAFGISLVFDADLVWVFEDGAELPIGDSDGQGAIRKLPSVRFRTIASADFVDAPAANDDGLFKSKPDDRSRTLRDVVRHELNELREEEKMADEEKTDEVEEVALEETKESAAEETEASEESPETLDVQEEVDRLRDDIGRHADRLDELEDGIANLKEKLGESLSKNEELSDKNKQLSAIVEGEDPLEVNAEPTQPIASIVDRFNAATGAAQTLLWNENKQAILASYTRGN